MSHPILRFIVAVQLGAGRVQTRLTASDRGQSTAEYALVLAGVAILVTAVFTLARGGSLGDLFDRAVKAIKLPGGN